MPPEATVPAPLDLSVPRRVHVIGVGGAGMSAIATVLADMGHSVTGSDLKASAVVDRLVARGIPVAVGHRADQVGQAEVVTWSPAVAADNPERVEAARGDCAWSGRAEMLAAIAATRRCLAVAGTHGKTTTASMLSLILVHAGLRPVLPHRRRCQRDRHQRRVGHRRVAGARGRRELRHLPDPRPEIAMVTNVEPDHLDHYGTFDALAQAFARFLGAGHRPARGGCRRPGGRRPGRAAGPDRWARPEAPPTAWSAWPWPAASVAFDLVGPTGPLGPAGGPGPGRHNARNAAVAAWPRWPPGRPFAPARPALARFAGVPRRFEFRGEASGVTFVDDYAHLPSEVRAALAAARAGDWGRVVAVFQPHRYTRTAALAASFADAFADADVVVVTDVYGAGERADARGVGPAGGRRRGRPPTRPRRSLYAPAAPSCAGGVAEVLGPGDLCCTLGAGDLTTLPDELLADADGGERRDAGDRPDLDGGGRGPRRPGRAGPPAGPATTYRVGGPAALFVEADDEGDLRAVRRRRQRPAACRCWSLGQGLQPVGGRPGIRRAGGPLGRGLRRHRRAEPRGAGTGRCGPVARPACRCWPAAPSRPA